MFGANSHIFSYTGASFPADLIPFDQNHVPFTVQAATGLIQIPRHAYTSLTFVRDAHGSLPLAVRKTERLTYVRLSHARVGI